MEQEISFNLIIVGDSDVGKSCILLRFSENTFKPEHSMTIGVEFGTKLVRVKKNLVDLQIWDTAGQDASGVSPEASTEGLTVYFWSTI